MRNTRFFAFFLVALLVVGAIGRAAIIFDNLNDPFGGARDISVGRWEALRFTTDSKNVTLDAVTLRLGQISTAGSFSLGVYSNVSLEPGSLIGTIFNGTTTSAGIPQSSFGNVAFPGLPNTLKSNTDYWLVVSIDAGNSTVFAWEGSSVNKGLNASSANQGVDWTVRDGQPGKARISAIPEPTISSLLLIGVLLAFQHSRRRYA